MRLYISKLYIYIRVSLFRRSKWSHHRLIHSYYTLSVSYVPGTALVPITQQRTNTNSPCPPFLIEFILLDMKTENRHEVIETGHIIISAMEENEAGLEGRELEEDVILYEVVREGFTDKETVQQRPELAAIAVGRLCKGQSKCKGQEAGACFVGLRQKGNKVQDKVLLKPLVFTQRAMGAPAGL